MTFSYNPDDAVQIVDAGIYDAVVFDAKAGETKQGASKLEVILKVYDPKGVNPLVTDHIVAPFGIKRLKQLCEACGVDFASGNLDPKDLVGKNVQVRLRVRTAPTGQFDDQNAVSAYLSDSSLAVEVNTAKAGTSKAQPDTSPALDEASAYAGYVQKVREEKPDATDALLMKNFAEACNTLVPSKERAIFTEADWITVRDGGPRAFVPF